MTKEAIIQHMNQSCPWQDSLLWFDCIDSTNTQAKLLAAQGAPAGTILIANHQTDGRGRRGRSFHSPAGTGIYLSIILRPQCAPHELMHLTCAAATAMCDAVEQAAMVRPGIKWTNDLVYGNRKVGGILTELGLAPGGSLDYAVIGVGLNCNQRESDFPPEILDIASSLHVRTGRRIDRAALCAAMCDAFYTMNQNLLTEKEAMLRRYRRDCVTLGKEVSVVHANGTIRHGIALDVDDTGALVVRFSDGTEESVNSGEVSIRGMYGYL